MVNKDTKMAAPRGGWDVCRVCEAHGTSEHGHTTLDICHRERGGSIQSVVRISTQIKGV
jgi:hypothetical protein